MSAAPPQVVMTSVYGVTRLGAKQQILNRLVEVHEVMCDT